MRLARSAAGCRCLQDQWSGVVMVVVVVVVVGSFGVVASVASAAARFRPVHWFEQPRRGRRALDAPRDTGNTKERVKTTLLVSYWLSTCRRTTTLEKRLFQSCRLCSTISQPICSTLHTWYTLRVEALPYRRRGEWVVARSSRSGGWLVVTHASAQARNAIRSSRTERKKKKKSKLNSLTPISPTSLTIFVIRMKVITATWTAETYNSPITENCINRFPFFPDLSLYFSTRSVYKSTNLVAAYLLPRYRYQIVVTLTKRNS